jgi:hypothetical protein
MNNHHKQTLSDQALHAHTQSAHTQSAHTHTSSAHPTPRRPSSASSQMSIGSILNKIKKNEFLEFLIIIDEEDYKGTRISYSKYEKIIKNKKHFNGKLHIETMKEMEKYNSLPTNPYLIEGFPTTHILYIKLPKEQLYVDSSHFHERYLNSKINELISIFSSLQAKKITVSIETQSQNELSLSLGLGLNVNGVSVKAGGENKEENSKSMKRSWHIDFFDKKDKKININDFADEAKFYYLPKETEWIYAIRKRITEGASVDKFTYTYSNTNNLKRQLFASLQLLEINCDYKKHNFENLKINYAIDYYPLEVVILSSQVEHKCKNCNTINHNEKVVIINHKANEEKKEPAALPALAKPKETEESAKPENMNDYVDTFLDTFIIV